MCQGCKPMMMTFVQSLLSPCARLALRAPAFPLPPAPIRWPCGCLFTLLLGVSSQRMRTAAPCTDGDRAARPPGACMLSFTRAVAGAADLLTRRLSRAQSLALSLVHFTRMNSVLMVMLRGDVHHLPPHHVCTALARRQQPCCHPPRAAPAAHMRSLSWPPSPRFPPPPPAHALHCCIQNMFCSSRNRASSLAPAAVTPRRPAAAPARCPG